MWCSVEYLPGEISMSNARKLARLRTAGCAFAASLSISQLPALAAEVASVNGQPQDVAVTLPLDTAPVESAKPAQTNAPVDGPVVIDNDDAALEPQYDWKEIPDADGKTHISAGARFPVVIQSAISSATAKVGDPVEGRMQVDIKISGRTVAHKGDKVVGHVTSVEKARKLLRAEFTPNHRWLRMAGALGIQLDEIVNADGEHIPLVAEPAKQPRIVKNDNEGRVLGVNASGQIASPLSTQLKSEAIHLAIRAAASAAGVFSFGAVPAAYACVGAISPSFAFQQPVGKNVRHRRVKGFCMGLVEGLPGGFIVSDSIIKGPEARVEPGDIFLAEFKQDFTGEPATEAELMPGARTKVHGEILPETKKDK
jgi:hypothetical protein